MKKTHSSEKVMDFFSKNIGFVGLLAVLNFLLIYLLFERLSAYDQRISKIETATGVVVKEIGDMSKPIVEDDTLPKKK